MSMIMAIEPCPDCGSIYHKSCKPQKRIAKVEEGGVRDDSALRIEIALRAGMIAKAALEMINLSPQIARLQIQEVARLLKETDNKLK